MTANFANSEGWIAIGPSENRAWLPKVDEPSGVITRASITIVTT